MKAHRFGITVVAVASVAAAIGAGAAATDGTPDWLDALNAVMRQHDADGTSAIVASSALKEAYRERLGRGVPGLVTIFLKGEPEILQARLDARKDHFMPRTMLPSQLAALEEPEDAIVVDAGLSPETIVGLIAERLESLPRRG